MESYCWILGIKSGTVPEHWAMEVNSAAQSYTVCGHYINGIGKARIVARSSGIRNLLTRHFGCPLIGSFNIETKEDTSFLPPSIRDGIHQFNFIRILNRYDESAYGWVYRWDGSRLQGTILEVYTKTLLPASFKNGELTVTFFFKWTQEFISSWQDGKYWFQGFQWLPVKRSQSDMIWGYLDKEDFRNKTVLDYGCHHGYYSFKASRLGAVVTAIDKGQKAIERAVEINHHIEQQDIRFLVGDKLMDERFDFIFELSVYHQIDPTYWNLAQHLEDLKLRCKVLYLELINPPLKGPLIQDQVDGLVGGHKLVHYKHRVRRYRTLYRLLGYA
jgi:2-polyprenyl-3-methyl-5-hydroxy-6-metoxy-1,4-benzoquinol methylase